jgi:hypothetical protein
VCEKCAGSERYLKVCSLSTLEKRGSSQLVFKVDVSACIGVSNLSVDSVKQAVTRAVRSTFLSKP